MEPRLKLLDSGGLVGVIRKDLNRPSCGARKALRGQNPLALFDRCAGRPLLHPPPAALRASARHSPSASGSPLSITEKTPPEWAAFFLAGAEGLEPSALGFGDRCSTN